jgi:S-DNA-T family DNA segregation ATPase FtsK/SpoIIIE
VVGSLPATPEYPFIVIMVDEIAFLTAYQPDPRLRDRIKAALATLTTQGRAVGVAVVAALQDPRKEVIPIRNLFPDRIAMRLDEPEQVDMVLGDGARDRGAACEQISTDPATGAGVTFIRIEADPDPVRVRAGWVADTDIRARSAAGALILCRLPARSSPRHGRVRSQGSRSRTGGRGAVFDSASASGAMRFSQRH